MAKYGVASGRMCVPAALPPSGLGPAPAAGADGLCWQAACCRHIATGWRAGSGNGQEKGRCTAGNSSRASDPAAHAASTAGARHRARAGRPWPPPSLSWARLPAGPSPSPHYSCLGESDSQQSLPTARGLGSGPVHGPAGPCFRVLASGVRLKAQLGQNPPPGSWGHGQDSGSWPRGPRCHIRPSPPRPSASSKRGGDPLARRKSSLLETEVARDPRHLPPLPVLMVRSKSRASSTRGRGPHRLNPGGRMVGPARGLPHTGVRRRAGPRRREGGPQKQGRVTRPEHDGVEGREAYT